MTKASHVTNGMVVCFTLKKKKKKTKRLQPNVAIALKKSENFQCYVYFLCILVTESCLRRVCVVGIGPIGLRPKKRKTKNSEI